jgi:mxaK protein
MLINGQQLDTRHSGAIERAPVGVGMRVGAMLRASRGHLLWLLLGVSLVVVALAGGRLLWREQTNARIGELRAGKDVAVDATSAPATLLEARAYFLLTRDRIEEAQPLLDQAPLRASGPIQVRMLYNIANARLRAAIQAIGQGNFDKAIPFVALAKSEYRAALRLDPDDWGAKYNLDVAMRLVRDLPRTEGEDDGSKDKPPANLWTELPGVPKGLP